MWTLAAEWNSLENVFSHHQSFEVSELSSITQHAWPLFQGLGELNLDVLAQTRFDLLVASPAGAGLTVTAAQVLTLNVAAALNLLGLISAVNPLTAIGQDMTTSAAFLDILSLALTNQLAGLWTVGAWQFGQQASAWSTTVNYGFFFMQTADFGLILAELLLFLGIGIRLLKIINLGKIHQLFYDDFITFCQQNGISVTEVVTLTSAAIGLLVFDIFFAFSEEDPADVLSYGILAFIGVTILGLLLAMDVFYYFMISGVGSGSATARAVGTDLVNNVLCLLRVFFCWTRYIFYDLQTELVDFTLQYTDTMNEGLPTVFLFSVDNLWGEAVNVHSFWRSFNACGGFILAIFLDLILMVAQLLMGFFKLAIALFLLWLIVDLFLLRALALSESVGLHVLRRAGL